MSIISNIESILFVASKPLTAQKIANAIHKQEGDVIEALENLKLKYNKEDSGIHILESNDTVQMATNPQNNDAIETFMKDEVAGELTKAQLETLTVIAYCGPISRPELEEIRGVNCSIIIRNLLMRALINEQEGKTDIMPTYTLSMDALSHLGIQSVEDLPEYEILNKHQHITSVRSEVTPEL
ncbi:MAG: SMC-Scp complex subunit ScpB [Candidatus Magasanikbacteria bacterium]|nr:SMC-Scp complex subunit ScpB [Candidatus Magasanikbacteria bacterium]NCS71880.1 SMC-Scp complex subunit ScpB [Candidatus Magasanikbacteria bacterium]